MLVNADRHLMAGRISLTYGASRDRLSGQVTDRHRIFLRPQDWQPQSALLKLCEQDRSTRVAVQPGGRISDQRVGVSQAAKAPNVRIAADRCPAVDDISTETAVLSKESFEVFQKLVIGMALFDFTRTIKSANSRYETNQFVSLG